MGRFKAFTLAEVLITLCIVGIIAALTFPMLMRRYNEIVTINQLRKVYAELQQAIQLSEVNNGSFRDWDYSLSSKEFAEIYIMPYLAKSYTKCNSRCFKGEHYWRKPNKTLDTTGEYQVAPHFFYRDKIIVINVRNIVRTDMNNIKYVNFIIDINGNSGESIMGKDVFMFTLFNYTYNTGGWVLTQLCPKGEHYGLYLGGIGGYWGAYCGNLDQMFDGGARGDCTINGSGTSCGLAIEKSGWRIPDKYPIKF